MSLRDRLGDPRTLFWIACGAFLCFYGPILDRLPHNLDEGVNLFDARFIAQGQRPYVDFFYHQLPVHLYALAGIATLAPESLYMHRLPSLISVAATGGVLYLIAARLASPAVAVLAAALYYAMPLQPLALLVLPNSPMLFFSTLAVWLILLHDGRRAVWLGAVSLLFAILWKPLAFATAIMIGILVLLDRTQRWKLVPMTVVLAVGGLASLAALHVLTQGAFTELLALQYHRYSRKTGFEIMQQYSTVQVLLRRMGVTSFLGWNIKSHFIAFDQHKALFLFTGAAGAWLVWRGRSELRPGSGRLLALWIAVPLFFSLFVWEPAWDHYHLQYLPALSILTAVVFRTLMDAEGGMRRVTRIVAGIGLVWTLVIGPLLTVGMLQDYARLRRMRADYPVLLSFDPFLNFVSGTEPACGVTDPLAQFSKPFFQDSPRFSRFVRSTDQLIACLEQAPQIRVLISTLQGASLWFIDERFYEWLRRQVPPRALYLGEPSRMALHTLFDEVEHPPPPRPPDAPQVPR
jgi:hypothetical protein